MRAPRSILPAALAVSFLIFGVACGSDEAADSQTPSLAETAAVSPDASPEISEMAPAQPSANTVNIIVTCNPGTGSGNVIVTPWARGIGPGEGVVFRLLGGGVNQVVLKPKSGNPTTWPFIQDSLVIQSGQDGSLASNDHGHGSNNRVYKYAIEATCTFTLPHNGGSYDSHMIIDPEVVVIGAN
ncbi:MAG: hypothetical protein OEZ54_08450 [Gemmatimonadota bacterium]|nr:hypothetical protein [Gemmatimonadota bacterium]